MKVTVVTRSGIDLVKGGLYLHNSVPVYIQPRCNRTSLSQESFPFLRYSSYRNYSDRSPQRHYRSPSRARSPVRYRNRRSRSKSTSLSLRRDRRRSRSRSPLPTVSDRLRSRLGPRTDDPKRLARSRSSSRSSQSSPSRSPVVDPKANRSPKRGLVSYGDISPNNGI